MPHAVAFALSSLLFVWQPSAVCCQGPDNDTEAAAEDKRDSDDVRPRQTESSMHNLPRTTSEGRELLPIGVYHSQLAELIPKEFQPIELDDLSEAIADAKLLGDIDLSSRLRASFYDVRLEGDTLFSDSSVLEIQSDLERVVRRPLGQVNLAITNPRSLAASSIQNLPSTQPYLESDHDGNLVAVFDGRQSDGRVSIQFQWSLRGRTVGTAREFLLQLPRSPQTRIVLSAPSDVVIEAVDGVFRKQPGPPPDANVATRIGEVNWYVLDVGGLSSVRLRARSSAESDERNLVVVRQSSISYAIEASGVRWTHRMRLQVNQDRLLPTLRVARGTVTSVRIDAIQTPFIRRDLANEVQLVSIPNAVSSGRDDDSVSLTIEGQSNWKASEWLQLPLPKWREDEVIHAQVLDQAELIVDQSLDVLSWELPSGWSLQPQTQYQENLTILRASGPPTVSLTDAADRMSSSSDGKSPSQSETSLSNAGESAAWSRIRLASLPATRNYDAALRLDLAQTSTEDSRVLDASIRLAIKVDASRIEPIPLRLQAEWDLLSIIIPASGHVIESPRADPATGICWIWPDVEDYSDDSIVIHASGRRRIPTSVTQTDIPSTWFVRVHGAIGTLTVAATPPLGFTWTADTALKFDRLDISQLNAEERAFLPSLGSTALAFACPFATTPPLSLEAIGVAFNVTSKLELRTEGDEVVETITIAADSPPTLPNELKLIMGLKSGRPDYQWTLRGEDNSGPLLISVSDITDIDEDSEPGVRIRLGERTTRGRRLVGRRTYQLAGPLSIQLPAVAGATGQVATAVIADGIQASELGTTVQKIPAPALPSAPLEAQTDSNSGEVAASSETNGRFADDKSTWLRYDPAARPSIVIDQNTTSLDTNLVLSQRVTIVASSSGIDTVTALFDATTTVPLVITHDGDLQLESITRDGIETTLAGLGSGPLRLSPSGNRETIRIVWNRFQGGSSWFRRLLMPRIEAKSAVISSSTRIVAAPDTFLPATLLNHDDSLATLDIPVSQGGQVLLIPLNVALSMGWLTASLVFCVSWYAARRRALFLSIPFVLAISLACLWWTLKTAIIGWVIVPIVIAGLLATSLRCLSDGPNRKISDDSRDFSQARESKRGQSSRGISVTSWILIASSMATGTRVSPLAAAQEASAPIAQSSKTMEILLPVDEDGAMVGNKVYIPDSLHAELFPLIDPDQPQDARFESAEYRVQLQQMSDRTLPQSPLIEADYVVHVPRQTSRLRLPFAATSVRRVSLRSVDQYRIVQFVPEGDNAIVITLPPGEAFRLRLTLMPEITLTPGPVQRGIAFSVTGTADANRADGTIAPGSLWKLRLSIPPIIASRLIVDGDNEEDRVTINEALGAIQTDRGLRRWTASLGPVERLSIDYQTASESNSNVTQPLTRRYWLNIGQENTSVDCELDFGRRLRFGDNIQLVTLDPMKPIIASKHWKMTSGYPISESRWSVTLTKMSDIESPVRLSWKTPTLLDSSTRSQSMTIPDVVHYSSNSPRETWIAIHSDPTIQVTTESQSVLEELSEEEFGSKWSGYFGRVDRVIRVSYELPKIIATRKPRLEAVVTQSHRLHVDFDRIRIVYEAVIREGESSAARRTLRIPETLELVKLLVDGKQVDAIYEKFDDATFVTLGEIPENETRQVEAVCEMQLPVSKKFRRPVLRIEPSMKTIDSYVLTRERALSVTSSMPADKAVEPNSLDFSDTLLLGGQVPVSIFRSETLPSLSSVDNFLAGDYTVSGVAKGFPSEQMIQLSWDDGKWSMVTRLRFLQRVPDYVDIAIPTRWCQSLDVQPSPLWSRQPAMDASRQIVRIACDPNQMVNRTLTIRGTLNDNDQGRIAVPNVSVLGAGDRKVFVAVPKRLTREVIQWRTVAMRPQTLPKRFAESASTGDNLQFFAATGAAWSVELATNTTADADAVAWSADAQVFPQDERFLVICRWDISPGRLESVDFRIPKGASCLNVWSANRDILPQPVTDTFGQEQEHLINVPLALSRLPQSVEMLLSVPRQPNRRTEYLPKLIGVPVLQQWAVHYRPNLSPRSSESVEVGQTAATHDAVLVARAIGLAMSVLAAVEKSRDLLADRPADEAAQWFKPWADRYQEVATSGGHAVSSVDREETNAFEIEVEDSTLPQGPPFVQTLGRQAIQNRWHQLDQRMLKYKTLFLPGDYEPQFGRFPVSNFEGYAVEQVLEIDSSSPPPSILGATPLSQRLRRLLTDLLTLAMIVGAAFLFWPMRQRLALWAEHPATWLALVGLCGMFVAPQPVSIAIMIVALTFPFLNQPNRPRRQRSN